MELTVRGHTAYCYTGGKPFDAARPTVVFIHGVLNDHSVWILQTRYLAHHGWNVLAVDLPGHCRSGGEAPASVEEGARFILDLLDAAGVQQAALVGHSFGSLIAMEAAAQAPERITRIALVGTAFPMKVSPALLDNALNAPQKAIDMVNVFSHSTLAPPPSTLGAGTWVYGGARALMRRVLASNPQVNVFHRGFSACDSYQGGEAAMEQAAVPGAVRAGPPRCDDPAACRAVAAGQGQGRPHGAGGRRPRHDGRGARRGTGGAQVVPQALSRRAPP